MKGAPLLPQAAARDRKAEMREKAMDGVTDGRGEVKAGKDVEEVKVIKLVEGFFYIHEGNVKGSVVVAGMVAEQEEKKDLELGGSVGEEGALFKGDLEVPIYIELADGIIEDTLKEADSRRQ